MSASNGPWSATPSGGGYRRKPYIVIRGPAPVSRRIARVDADQPEAAALIASAPALVSALEAIMNNEHACVAMTTPQHRAAMTALRLARGEA